MFSFLKRLVIRSLDQGANKYTNQKIIGCIRSVRNCDTRPLMNNLNPKSYSNRVCTSRDANEP